MSKSQPNWGACFDIQRTLFETEGYMVEGKVWNDGCVVVAMHPTNKDARGMAGVTIWHATGLYSTVDERTIVALEQMRLRCAHRPHLHPSSAAAWLTILIEGYYSQFPDDRQKLN